MIATGLRCTNCAFSYPLELHYHCEQCGFPLAVTYERSELEQGPSPEEAIGVWRYGRSLPTVRPEHRISLGEGGTPLLEVPRLGESMGFERLLVKNESTNPTGSFKDRPTAVGVSMARELGIDTVVCSSTGNAGMSLAAFAARAGLRAVVLASDRMPRSKIAPIAIHGADVVRVRGSVSDAFRLAHEAAQAWGWMNLTSTFLNPFTVEGNKTVAYELAAQLHGVPDYILAPVSVGALPVGIFRGFTELRESGLVDRVPKLIAVQASRCAPLAAAFERGDDRVEAWHGPADTIAAGIADPLEGYEQDGSYALRVIRESGGLVLACGEDEILAAGRALVEQEGIFAEPTGAVAVAALPELLRREALSPLSTVVAIVTGHGLKAPAALASPDKTEPSIEPNLAELEAALSSPGRA